MTVIVWAYGVAALLYAAFAGHLAWSKRDWRAGPASAAMFAAACLTATWAGLSVAVGLAREVTLLPVAFIADALRYGAWYAFLLLLIRPVGAARSPARFLAPAAGVLVVTAVGIHGHAALVGSPAQTESLASLNALAMIIFGLVLLEQVFRNVEIDSRWNVKPLALGLGAAFLFDLYLFAHALLFGRLDGAIFAARGLVHACVLPILLVSTLRTKDWGAKIRLSQKAAFHSATLVVIGGYLLFMAAVGYWVRNFGGDWGSTLQVALVAGAMVGLAVLVFSGSMRAKMRVFIGKHFFSYRYDYREEWLRFTQTLSSENSAASLEQQAIRAMANLVESPGGGLWMRGDEGRSFTQTARWNVPDQTVAEPVHSSLCRFLSESGWVINLEEFRSYPRRYEALELPHWLSDLPNAWLIVPLLDGNSLMGYVVLSSARTSMDVNWEVNDLLRTAGRQAASYLAQMRANNALLEARKFDAFNRMSAFVVHDLKNIVSQLALMLKNAERHRANPEFQKDMLMTVEHSVERMRQLMLQLREGATPPGTPVGVDLGTIIERIHAAKTAQGREVELFLQERLMTRGHPERIERVIGHLIQNALDATEGTPARSVRVRLGRQGGQALLEVEDNGTGMSQEFVRERLFKPFQTTKDAGMGIGAYESFQYLQELGGKISVDSRVGEGTRIGVLLPLFEVEPAMSMSRPTARQAA
ncbi:MAG: PEP-CTERM system histidine kinase PrsK [Burkholderiales bacterium]|nr:PEP-CTERM system histidine kinase PrsK [Burkholderiales bacterium]